MSKRAINSFAPLWRDLLDRIRGPVGSVSFWVLVFVGAGFLGGIAIWVEIVKYGLFSTGERSLEGVRLALNTYFPAVGCSAALQIGLVEKDRPYLRALGHLVWTILFVACILAILMDSKYPAASLAIGVFASALSLLVFWIANGADSNYWDTDPDASVGGTTDAALTGDTSGFKV